MHVLHLSTEVWLHNTGELTSIPTQSTAFLLHSIHAMLVQCDIKHLRYILNKTTVKNIPP